MRKIKKILICVTFIIVVGIAYFFNMEEVHAASGDVIDITPPRGIVKVEGATLKDEVYYIGSTNITLNIEVVDDYTEPENIKMILSSGEITGEIAVNDDNWKPYQSTKNWQIEAGKENLIYLYLKDEAQNISPNIIVDASANYTITYSGEGENLPSPKSAQYGMLFNVSIQEPTNGDKYFLGWSETPNGSVQWLSDSVIEAKYIKGDKTLYAIYADEAPLLANQVEIGDYVDYPLTYENIYSTGGTTYKSAYTGWRVMDISGDEVTIVTAGTPLLFYHGNKSADSVEKLTKYFLSGDNYTNNGFDTLDLAVGFNNEFTKSVESMNKNDIDKLVGETTTNGFGLRIYGSLLDNGTYYWLASANNATYLWYVYGYHGIVYSNLNNTSYGVRPKVSLVSGIKTSGRNISGVWKLEAP